MAATLALGVWLAAGLLPPPARAGTVTAPPAVAPPATPMGPGALPGDFFTGGTESSPSLLPFTVTGNPFPAAVALPSPQSPPALAPLLSGGETAVPAFVAGISATPGIDAPRTLAAVIPAAEHPAALPRAFAAAEAETPASPQPDALLPALGAAMAREEPPLNRVFDNSPGLPASGAGADVSVGQDPLDSIFVQGSIFSPEFLREERELSRERRTLAFDVDSTLGHYNGETRTWILRPGIIQQLKHLRKEGFRLVVWTDSASPPIRRLFRTHPALQNLFERVITLDNTLPAIYMDPDQVRDAYAGADWESVRKYYDRFVDPQAKDILLLGYAGLIDDRVVPGAERSPLGRFRIYRIRPYYGGFESEDIPRLSESIRHAFRRP